MRKFYSLLLFLALFFSVASRTAEAGSGRYERMHAHWDENGTLMNADFHRSVPDGGVVTLGRRGHCPRLPKAVQLRSIHEADATARKFLKSSRLTYLCVPALKPPGELTSRATVSHLRSSSGFSWSADPYYGGFVSWPYVPVKVKITAGNEKFSGTVRYVSFIGKGSSFVYEKPVSVDPGETAAFVIYIPSTTGPTKKVTLELLHDGKVESRNIKLTTVGGENGLSAAMDYSPTILGLPSAASNGIWWVHLPIEDFPGSVQGLMPLRVILSPAKEMEKLDDEQKQVLLTWVSSGGVLVLAGDPAGLTHLPAEMRVVSKSNGVTRKELPVRAFGLATKSRPPVVLHYLSEPSVDSVVLVKGDDGSPWLIGKAVGWGRVVYLAFDQDNPPLSGWNGAPGFWSSLSNKVSGGKLTPLASRSFRTPILSQLSGGVIPSLTLLFLIFFLYLLVVGPLNYFVLKRLTKLEYAWITIPAITLMFTAGIYLAGNAQRSRELHVSRYSVVRLRPDQNYGLAEGGMAVYSTTPISTSFDLPSSFLIHPATIGSKGSSDISVKFKEGYRSSVALFSGEGWKLAALGFEGIVANPGVKFSSVEMKEKFPLWRIKNETGKELETPILLIGKHAFLYGDVRPGGASEEVVEENPVRAVWVEDSLEDLFMPRSMYPPDRRTAKESLFAFAKADMVSEYLLGLPMDKFRADSLVRPGMSHKVFAVAWVKEPVPDIAERPDGDMVKQHAMTAIVAPVGLKYKGKPARVLLDENFRISNDVLSPQGRCGPPGEERYFFGEGRWNARWNYELGIKDDWRPFRITWRVFGADVIPPPGVVPDGGRDLRDSIRFYIYNFEKGVMERMQVTKEGTVEISNPAPYWRNGTMKVALQGNDEWPGGCAGADVEVLEVAP